MDRREENLARALSAQARRDLLRHLGQKECSVKELADRTNMSMSLTSRHLTLLRDLGFLIVTAKHPHKYYSLHEKNIITFIQQYQKAVDASWGIKERREESLSRAIDTKVRRQILSHLSEGSNSVQNIAQFVGMSTSLTSRHLKLLADLGVLTAERKHPHTFYVLSIKEIKKLMQLYDAVSCSE